MVAGAAIQALAQACKTIEHPDTRIAIVTTLFNSLTDDVSEVRQNAADSISELCIEGILPDEYINLPYKQEITFAFRSGLDGRIRDKKRMVFDSSVDEACSLLMPPRKEQRF